MKKKTNIPMIGLALLLMISVVAIKETAVSCEFPLDGDNVADLDTDRVTEMIAKIKNLDDGSQLCVNEDAFDLMFTSDFHWANDGAIRFFYIKNHKTYSAQLRMFHSDNKYFVTDSSNCPDQTQSFKLIHYLNALKYLPQEEIRKLSPDADGYCMCLRNDGIPSDYERVLTYSQNGAEDIDGWKIHLEIQPLHKVSVGGYNGSGDEVIHLFYNNEY